MTVIKIDEDPGCFSFEIINDQDKIEVLRINVLEVMMYLESTGKDSGDQVVALRACAKPKEVAEKLADHELMAKWATAAIKFQQLGKELGFSLTLPVNTGSSSGQRGPQTGNMQPA